MDFPSNPRIAVVGSGALGGYIGARLAHAGHDVHFLVRSGFKEVAARGWQVRSIGEPDFAVQPANVYANASEIGKVDLVLIGLKTTQNPALSDLLDPLLHPGTVLVTLQNGLGVTEELKALYPRHAVVAGICHVAANRVAPGVIVNQAPRGGHIRLASTTKNDGIMVDHLAAMMRASGLQSDVLPSVEEGVWRKLMWNVPFNGLPVALGGQTSQDVLADPALTGVARGLMEELRAAGNARGCTIPPEFTEQLIEFTRHLGAYQASTVVDFLAGRSLEVESIWGEPLRQGRAAGVAMPHLATLYAILKGLDQHREQPS